MLLGIVFGFGIATWLGAHVFFLAGYGHSVRFDVHQENDADGEPYTCCSVCSMFIH